MIKIIEIIEDGIKINTKKEYNNLLSTIPQQKRKYKKTKVSRLEYYKNKVIKLEAHINILQDKLNIAEKKLVVLNKYGNKFCYLDKQFKKVKKELDKDDV